jgi:hypothetical protein
MKLAEEAPNAILSNAKKLKSDYLLINNALNRHFIFASLTEEAK